MKRRLTYWRRRTCVWLGHPLADWAPIVMYETSPATLNADGTITDGTEYTVRAWRCAKHDKVKK